MKRTILWLMLLVALGGLLPSGSGAAITKPQGAIRLTGGEQCFAETGHCLRGVFRGYWLNNGGVARFGLPITDELTESRRTVLYTERARFELHPEYRNTASQVLLGLLGKELTAGRSDSPFKPTTAQMGAYFFTDNNNHHNLAPPFLDSWQNNGGLAVYGYPLSEAFTETSPTDGKPYLVQYFERNRFEYHPDLPTTYRISLGLLGEQAYQRLYGNAPAPIPGKDYAPDPISLTALRQELRWGDNLRTLRTVEQASSYTKYAIAYTSGELNISGVMCYPHAQGDGPFPVIILGHGYLPTSEYYSGEDSRRECPYLAAHGYVAIHPDFRNYATSDVDPDADLNMTALGWTDDALNLIDAVKRSDLAYLDKTRIGYWGHSNGGQVGLQLSVTQSDIKAFVLFAPTSPDYADNFNRWMRTRLTEQSRAQLEARHGLPEDNPTFYAGLSFSSFVAQVNTPIMIIHGQSDTNTPYAWSVRTNQLLVSAGKDVTFISPPNENHLFSDAYWPTAAQRMLDFFDARVKGLGADRLLGIPLRQSSLHPN